MSQPTGPVYGPSSSGASFDDDHAVSPNGTPPNDLDAERAVVGICMALGRPAIDAARAVLDAGDFYRPAHETIWRAILDLTFEGAPTAAVAVADRLRGDGALERVGGVNYLVRLAAEAPPSADNADYYAAIVRRESELRKLHATGIRTVQQALLPGAQPDEIRSALDAEVREGRERALASGNSRLSRFMVDGWDFVTKTGADKEPLWGTRGETAWAAGESLMIVGAPGVGKTTIAHQVIFARIGLGDSALGMPVAESKRVLYLAMDRPQQIARAMARLVRPEHEKLVRERLLIWEGPLPTSLDKEPGLLAELATAHGADTIVIDSLKDAVSTLVDDSLAIAYNSARNRALREGIQVLELHHQRKATADAPRGQRPTLDRVYGSTWLTSGAGSVLFIAGEAGDPVVNLHHLKTVTGEIGPLTIVHDHEAGTSTVEETIDIAELLRAAQDGVTAKQLATAMTGDKKPDAASIGRARRRLNTQVKSGLAEVEKGSAGGIGGGKEDRYFTSARHINTSVPPTLVEQPAIPLAVVPAAPQNTTQAPVEPALTDAESHRVAAATATSRGTGRFRERSRISTATTVVQPVVAPDAPRKNRR
ncbi:DnaB-like helicase N-terminal domain-containing protein [Kitasatospora purpeofusca]|uniref:DnaB-like helicase N-terminal domain-containing protein n=1 Tax=Kitasatospora purpeofusca TaxID=67352 RepID=UPI002A5AD86D|nr:DnaB-like helicase N-terminal domain-containing protein [Kitasatospora purpeofusca]MDY0811625.1 DnaB-like helicase N-terminal domain-containing protein [Kitasatospora purpeofusca]